MIMKKFATATLAAALFMTMSNLFSPVLAAEKNTTQFEVEYKDEKSVKKLVASVFNEDVKDFDVEKTSEGTVYSSDSMSISVEGIDLKKKGVQDVTLTKDKSLKELGSFKNFVPSKKEEKNIKVNVVDTTKPVIKMEDEVSTPVGKELDLASLAKVKDNHKVASVKVKGDVDYNKAGNYDVKLIAKDASGNKAEKEITVKVGNLNQKIADAALAQLGVYQDCTMLVTNSLRAVGINFHGAPEEYLSLGTLTDSPVPGDICVYSGHVAVYIGNGQAVHGGWLGNQTVVSSVACTNAFIGYVHINL